MGDTKDEQPRFNPKKRGRRGSGRSGRGRSGSSKGHQYRSNSNGNNRDKRSKKEYCHVEKLTESEVGITEYRGDNEGFSGVLKCRFCDFNVNEIDLNDKVAEITNINFPEEEKLVVKAEILESVESPIELLPQDIWNALKNNFKNKSEEKVSFDATNISKDERLTIHTQIREIFGGKFVSNTIGDSDNRILEFKFSSSGGDVRGDDRKPWPKEWNEFVHFLLYKEGIDTINACYMLSSKMGIHASQFNYAGLKDKRAQTTQWVSLKKVKPEKLKKCHENVRDRMNRIKIGNVTFKNSALKLGELTGNRFKIAVRNIVVEDSKVEKYVEYVKENGFINYFGLQRFGNDKEVPTYAVGIKLLLGKYEEACKLILKPKPSDEPKFDISKAKKIYSETGDAKLAFNSIGMQHRDKCFEAKLLGKLAEDGKNFVNALEKIPRNLRSLYTHSFQSLIWNKMVSKRIQKFGFKPVVSDLVVVNDVVVNDVAVDDVDVNVEMVEGDDSNEVLEEKKPEEVKRQQVKALEESDLSSYTIYDIVLPLPGFEAQYPDNMRDEYKEEIEKHGLTLEMPKPSVKSYVTYGSYRKIMGRATDLKWKVMKYNEPEKSLILSDYENFQNMEEPQSIPDGKYKALILEFSLLSSCYATMMLRELMKIDTSPSAQMKLNNYADSSDTSTDTVKKIESKSDVEEEKLETIDSSSASSLLNNEEKMEEFKKSIYAECKRRNEEDGLNDPKKIKVQNE